MSVRVANPTYRRIAVSDHALHSATNGSGGFRVRQLRFCSGVVSFALLVVCWVGDARAQQDSFAALNRRVDRLVSQGKHEEAGSILQRDLVVREKALGPDHPEISRFLYKLAGLRGGQRRYAEAESLYKRALKIVEKNAGKNHDAYGAVLQNLAVIYQAQGRFVEAEPLFKRSLVIAEKTLGPDHLEVGHVLSGVAANQQALGRFAEAEPLYKRSLTIYEKALDPDNSQVGTALGDLARNLSGQGRFVDAEPLYKRHLRIYEKAFGPDHSRVGAALVYLARNYRAQGRFAEAELLYKRSLAIYQKAFGPDHANVGNALIDLAALYRAEARYSEAEPLFKRSLEIYEKALGPQHAQVGTALGHLGEHYSALGRFAEAESLFKRSLAIIERAFGPGDARVGTVLNNIAALLQSQDRYAEAEPIFKRSLKIYEKVLGPDHREVGASLGNLAELYRTQARYGEAEPLYKRSLTILEKQPGPTGSNVAIILNNLANLYRDQGRYTEAEPLYKRSLANNQKRTPGSTHPEVAVPLVNLAALYRYQGRHSEAEQLFKRGLAIFENALGPSHPHVAQPLNNLASLYLDLERYDEAEVFYKRSLVIREKALGPDHSDVGTSLNDLALLAFTQRKWSMAFQFAQRGTNLLIRRTRRSADSPGVPPSGQREAEVAQNSFAFTLLVKSEFRASGLADAASRARTFVTAQWAAQSDAAAALARSAARDAGGDGSLGIIVRERQDLVSEWQARDKLRIAAVSKPSARRNAIAEAENVARLEAIDARLKQIDARLESEFPDYAALANPQPLKIADVQANLAVHEALILFRDTSERKSVPEETFIWVVTRTGAKWYRSAFGRDALKQKVAALRKALDPTGGGARAAQVLGGTKATVGFDNALAHELYTELLAPAETLLAGKTHLLLVPSGALTALPFHVLRTEPAAKTMINGKEPWLIRRYALTTLPSVASLAALRRKTDRTPAPKAYVGYADPVFSRAGGPVAKPARVASATRGLSRFFRGAQGDGTSLASLRRLADTADEVQAISRLFSAAQVNVFLRDAVTEAAVRTANLKSYRVVHFATHGLVAGEIKRPYLEEPALALSQPAPGARHDGLLTASEVAMLKLNADWVILSACNTAAGDRPGAEALSGLARSFFYAGTRALLVSHWPVVSSAAVKLTTRTFKRLRQAPSIGRAAALQGAMLSLSDSRNASEAHPSYWAPFVVVGEGGTGR
jgi:CHAT domain-containing protein/tetratricopeptide (TPR) repeat protein